MKVMLADDEESMRTLVEHLVRDCGYEFCFAEDGIRALQVYDKEHPDLLILDIMMPGQNGFEVCSTLRDRGEAVPIIFLTAKGDIVDKSVGFKAGGDDYLVKPFSPKELSLRIDALLRRSVLAQTPKKSLIPNRLEFDGLSIDVESRQVTVEGRPVELTPKEFHVLYMLAGSPGKIFTRDQIIEDVWGPEYVGGSSSITVLIRRIRMKIEKDPSNPEYVQTIWHVGYRFGPGVQNGL